MKSIREYPDLRTWLADWTAARTRGNSRLSLTSSARFLRMTPSMLSQVIHGKKHISRKQAAVIADRTKLTEPERRHLLLLGDLASTPSESSEFARLSELLKISMLENRREKIDRDLFKYFSNWFTLPIFVMCTQSDFDLPPAEIAARLGIATEIVSESLERMERIGVLRKDGTSGRLVAAKAQPILLAAEGKSAALLEFHKEMLRKTLISIGAGPVEERYVGTETFRFSKKQMPKARAAIDLCLDTLLCLNAEAKLEVESSLYHVGIQLFRLAEFPAVERPKKESA